jgi:hypothetical protein
VITAVAKPATAMPSPAPAPAPRGRLRRAASANDPLAFYGARTEHARERDVLRHLHSWIDVHQPPTIHRNAFPTDGDKSPPIPQPCEDAALAAFAQLCALRLNVRRVLITLMSGNVEYVLAEATRTMSLDYDNVEDPKDALWLGTCSFPRDCGINAHAIAAWRKARRSREPPPDSDFYYLEGRSPHWCIASDARNNTEYGQTVFVQHAPWLRFFCSIPLRDLSGSVIGSLSVLDDRPRYGVSFYEMLFLEDSASNIAGVSLLIIRFAYPGLSGRQKYLL